MFRTGQSLPSNVTQIHKNIMQLVKGQQGKEVFQGRENRIL